MIKKEVDELDKFWNELIYNISDGNASEIMTLRRFDIIDLFEYIENKTKKNG